MSADLIDLKVYLLQKQQIMHKLLDNILPPATHEPPLNAAIRYAVLNSGKRLRPTLVYAVGEVLAIPSQALHAAAMSVELIHCYSLIHDDLPAMDDDDLRRGMPSCHKAFDEATAILAGDGLQALAFEVLSDPNLNPVSPQQQIAMVQVLAKASGIFGMVLGQAEDMAAEKQTLNLLQLSSLHNHKTGALFNACIELSMQASPAPVDPDQAQQLRAYGRHLGLAFQIQDDILDEIGDEAQLGKPVGSDQKHAKATFTSLLGIAGAQEHASENLRLALEAVAMFGPRGEILRRLAEFLVARTY